MKTIRDENLKTLKGKTKIEYFWDYYKLPLAILGVLLYILAYILYGHFTAREPVLYVALVNVNAGGNLKKGLGEDFLGHRNLNPSKNKLELYTGLNRPNHAVIDGELLDVVLMNQEAFDAFSQNGYLYDLEDFLPQADSGLYNAIKPDLAANIVILEDNQEELLFDSSASYHAVTEEHYYGIDLSRTTLIDSAGFHEPVYFGIVANSPRTDNAVEYLKYLYNYESSGSDIQ